ncbi:MAG: arylamine N-acetyltransferase [Armatimonadetes bacterium]|nr:arylamine N-acetyltransferase [Armatimonadota bacterium]
MDADVDLNLYGERIGVLGPLSPDLSTLRKIQFGHSTNIPFENLDVLLGQPILLDIASLQGKLIEGSRGGYCFEQNGLMLEMLRAIGFDAVPLSGRVRIGVGRDFMPARTHLFIKVRLDGEDWLGDGGVGGMSLTAPIRFVVDEEQETPHDRRRIVRENGIYYHQTRMGEEWVDVYEFTGEEMPLIDREVGNWWTSTNPRSKFKQGLFCALARPDGERIGLLDRTFTHRRGAEILRKIEIDNISTLEKILSEEFGLDIPPGLDFGLWEGRG